MTTTETLEAIKARIEEEPKVNVNDGQSGEYWHNEARCYDTCLQEVYELVEAALEPQNATGAEAQ